MKRAIAYIWSALTAVFLVFFVTWLINVMFGGTWATVALVFCTTCSPWIADALNKRLLRKTA